MTTEPHTWDLPMPVEKLTRERFRLLLSTLRQDPHVDNVDIRGEDRLIVTFAAGHTQPRNAVLRNLDATYRLPRHWADRLFDDEWPSGV